MSEEAEPMVTAMLAAVRVGMRVGMRMRMRMVAGLYCYGQALPTQENHEHDRCNRFLYPHCHPLLELNIFTNSHYG
jgi:hypothetical protein